MRAADGTAIDSSTRASRRLYANVALALCVLAIWTLTHEYKGLVYDGQIYAMQALAKLHPALDSDLFLQNTTQDRFTIFPRLYAWVIAGVGLNPAALLLIVLCSVWFLAAAWSLMKHAFDRNDAWLALLLLVISGGSYGAFGVFHFMEPFMTARLPAEALVVTALGLHLRGHRGVALALAVVALFVHPIMGLPGLMLLILLRLPLPVSLVAMTIGVLGCLILALSAQGLPSVTRIFPLMDAAWLDIVKERSQFLFVPLWTPRDWALNARPFACLTLTAITLQDPQIRKLCLCAMLVGAAGLAVATIASSIGPVALLVQGQAWRWMWIATFVSVIFIVPTARHLWSTGAAVHLLRADSTGRGGAAGHLGRAAAAGRYPPPLIGRVSALLLVAGWSLFADVGCVYTVLALVIWRWRHQPWLQSDATGQWMMVLILASVAAWGIFYSATAIASLSHQPQAPQSVLSSIRAILGLRIWCVVLGGSAWYWVSKYRSRTAPLVVAGAATVIAALFSHEMAQRAQFFGSAADQKAFADWRKAVPPGSTVFVTNGHDSGSFVWFTLQRDNYLSPGQSAGVVFSRATALEVKRRSEVLLPLVEPNWKMMTSLNIKTQGSAVSGSLKHYPLTAKSLIGVCADPMLDFVIAPNDVGFEPLRHTRADAYQNWNLYDCGHVRMARSPS